MSVRPINEKAGIAKLIGDAPDFDRCVPKYSFAISLGLLSEYPLKVFWHLDHDKIRQWISLVNEGISIILQYGLRQLGHRQ
jgi:hypothetical protein